MKTLTESFRNPPNEYRPLQIVHGLERSVKNVETLEGLEGIDARLARLRDLGIGGIVTNVSFANYLKDPKQWDILRYGMKKAGELGMVVWLYDENVYPSGSAGGYVPRAHPEYGALGLAAYAVPAAAGGETRFDRPDSCRSFHAALAVQDSNAATSQTVRDISNCVDETGTLRWQAPGAGWTVVYLAERYMYEGTHSAGNVSHWRRYINLLEPGATKEFIRLTHERYAREIPAEQWRQVRAMFMDEPSFMTAYVGPLPDLYKNAVPVVDQALFTDRPPAVPWAGHLAAEFQRLKGYDLKPFLYALFFSESEEACGVRQDYYDVISRLAAGAFYGQIQDWCQAHGIASSGHVMYEEDLVGHVSYHGSLFTALRRFDLPGIDMLESDPQKMLSGAGFMTAKLVSSVAHLTGAKEVHSESSDWVNRSYRGKPASLPQRLGQGNLQYVLGVNTITAYWLWGDPQEEYCRDYGDFYKLAPLTMPGDIGDEGYRAYNDYMARLGLLLRGGAHVCDVAVLYPIRAAWAHYRPTSPNEAERLEKKGPYELLGMEQNGYHDLVRTLLRHQVDLDIVDEEAVLTGDLRDGALHVADEAFRVIVIPPMDTMSLEVARRLTAFVKAGGSVVFTADLPRRADSPKNTAALQAELQALVKVQAKVRLTDVAGATAVVRALVKPDLKLKAENPDILYTHRRKDGRDLYFIINCGENAVTVEPELGVPGPYDLYRPLTGAVEKRAGVTALKLDGYEGVFMVSAR